MKNKIYSRFREKNNVAENIAAKQLADRCVASIVR